MIRLLVCSYLWLFPLVSCSVGLTPSKCQPSFVLTRQPFDRVRHSTSWPPSVA